VQTGHSSDGFQAPPLAATTVNVNVNVNVNVDVVRYLFDTSNIAESYPGVTSPLTFSHIRLAYATAYEESARLCGVADDELAAHHRAFETLLARIDGRVHYHLPSWFQVLALYPGCEKNRAHMLDMMGADAVSSSTSSSWATMVPGPPVRSIARRLAMAWRMARTFSRRHRLVRDFHQTLEAVLVPLEQRDWQTVSGDDVVVQWHSVRHRLLHGWQAPLLADFLAMLSHGSLRAFCARRGVNDVVVADLFAGADIPSVAPARALVVLARQLGARSRLREAFIAATVDDALELIRRDPLVGAGFAHFLARFGARAMHELKLEQPTWRDEPGFLVRQLQDLVRATVGATVGANAGDAGDADVDHDVDPDDAGRRRADAAEAVVRHILSLPERLVFGRLVDAARTWTGHREAMRYARARTFAVLRAMALRLGDVLVQRGLLDSRRDVFFLEHDELTGVFDGTATTWNLRGLVALRRAEDDASAKRAPGADRLAFAEGVILGPPLPLSAASAAASASAASASVASAPASSTAPGDVVLHGVAVVRGRVTGPVRVVACADDARDVPGHVLVCPRTDPGFAALFPGATALVVERGSPLSHCAIVARELGLPTIVNVRGLLAAVGTGTGTDSVTVTVDGAAGTVTVHGSPLVAP